MRERAVLYARVSTEVQGDGYSLQTQLDSCRHYAAQHGYQVVGEYSDQQSGELLERHQLGRLIEQVHLDSVPVVVVHSLDRLTRDRGHLAILELELERAGARVEFVLNNYADTAEGQLSKEIEIAIAQYENRQRTERIKRGRRGRLAAGRVRIFGKRAPYGYTYVSDNREFAICDDEAAVVRWLFEHAAAGEAPYTLAANLTAAGRPTPSQKNRAWQPCTIRNILRKSLYHGLWSEHIDGVEYTVNIPAIVSEDLWVAVQQRLDAPRTRSAARPFLLTGFLKCACGKAWNGITRETRVAYYRCNSIYQRYAQDACPLRGSIRADRLEEATWSAIVALLQQPAWLDIALAQRQQEIAAAHALHDQRIQTVVTALAEIDRQTGALLDELLDGRITSDAVAQRRARLAAERTRLETELARYQEAPLPATPIVDQAALVAYIESGLAALDFAQRRQLLSLLDLQLVVERLDCIRLTVLDGLVTQTISDIPLDNHSPAKPRTEYRPRKEITL